MSRKIEDGLTPQQRYKLRHPGRATARTIAWRKANPEKAYANSKASRERSRARDPVAFAAKQLAKSRARSAKYPDRLKAKGREWQLRSKFGMTVAAYDAMLEVQRGLCAICGGPPGKRMLAVDHNHTTGAVRALLCDGCNLGLGHLEEHIDSVVAYLKRYV